MPEVRDRSGGLVLFAGRNRSERIDAESLGPNLGDSCICDNAAPFQNRGGYAASDDDERFLRVEERGDTVRKRRVVPRPFLRLLCWLSR